MLWALIMAGGQGTRFWPESRRDNPKQFLKLVGKKSLLENTVTRIRPIIPSSRVLIVSQLSKTAYIRKHLKQIPKSNVLGEPVGRNTAPCAALTAAWILRKDPEAVLAVLPSDHHIENEKQFRKALTAAYHVALKKRMPVTFGIQPDSPNTGYGYLEAANLLEKYSGFPVYKLKQFHEKPDLKKAKAFVRSSRFTWNSGMFVWRADELLASTQKYLPKAYELSQKILSGDLNSNMKRYYSGMPNISIDYGLMEKMRGRILTIPVKMGWSDVGDWKSVSKFWDKDRDKNSVTGSVLSIESSGNVVKGRSRLIVLVGMRDHVVVDSEDAVLIVPKDKTQSIRKVVDQLKNKNLTRYL